MALAVILFLPAGVLLRRTAPTFKLCTFEKIAVGENKVINFLSLIEVSLSINFVIFFQLIQFG